jgi:hypothetical protein
MQLKEFIKALPWVLQTVIPKESNYHIECKKYYWLEVLLLNQNFIFEDPTDTMDDAIANKSLIS